MIKKIFISFLFLLQIFPCLSQENFNELNTKGNSELDSLNYKKALEYFDKALNIGSDTKSEMVWTSILAATCATQLNDNQKTIHYNNIAIDNGCTDLTLIEQQLKLAENYNDFKTREKVLLYARELEDNYLKYTLKLLYLYYNNQQYENTISTAEQVLSVKPDHFNARYLKSLALLNTGYEKEAILSLNQLHSEDPANTKVLLQLGLYYFNSASAVFDRANKKYKGLTNPTRTDYHNYRQEIRPALENYEACIPFFEKYQTTESKQNIDDAITLAKNRINQITQD